MKHISEINPTANFPQPVRDRIAREVAKLEPAKRCCTCKLVKPLSDYHRNASAHDGRQSQCKPCKIEQAQKDYEKYRPAMVARVRERRHRDKAWQQRLAAMKSKAGAA